MPNPFLGSGKVQNAYFACDREILNMADKYSKQQQRQQKTPSTVFSHSLNFHNIFVPFCCFTAFLKCARPFSRHISGFFSTNESWKKKWKKRKKDGTLPGKHAYWRLICLVFTKVVWVLLSRLWSLRSWANRNGEWKLYLHSFEPMLPYFMRYDHTN